MGKSPLFCRRGNRLYGVAISPAAERRCNGVLQRKELIEYTRGAVKIVNRKKLDDSACECYGVIRQYDGELGLKYNRP